jgi:hypothetical protein
MTVNWILAHYSYCLSAVFVAAALAHLGAPQAMRERHARWRFPRGYREVTGALLALAAALNAFPMTRLAGLGIAALALFLSATTLLYRRRYGTAVPLIVLLFALIPASLSAPV